MITKYIIYENLEYEAWWMAQFGWKVHSCTENKEVDKFASYKEGIFENRSYYIKVMQYKVVFLRNTDMPQHEKLFKLYDSYFAAKEHKAKCVRREEKNYAPVFCLLFLGYLVFAFFYGVMRFFDIFKGFAVTFKPYLVINVVLAVVSYLRYKRYQKKTQEAEQAMADILAKANKMSGIAPFKESQELLDYRDAQREHVKKYAY